MASDEIVHLLAYIKASDCQFIRNSKVYTGKEGLEHVKKKYEYFKKKIETAEDFIKYSATKSELSGKMYFETPTLMRELLEAEGVEFSGSAVDLKKHIWDPNN